MRDWSKREIVGAVVNSLRRWIFALIGFGHDGDFAGRAAVLPFQLHAKFASG